MIESGDADVDRLRRAGLHNLRNLILFVHTWRVDTISPRFSVSNEPVENRMERAGIVDQPRFAAAGEPPAPQPPPAPAQAGSRSRTVWNGSGSWTSHASQRPVRTTQLPEESIAERA